MGMRINTNVASISARRTLGLNTNNLNNNLRKLASGERITTAADDAAGLAISENLKAQIRGYRQSKRNANDAISLIQTAEGGLNEISNIVIRLRELSVQAASDTVGPTERGFSDIEFQQLKEEIDRISKSSDFNGVKLLDGSGGTFEFQVGIHNDPTLDRLTYDAVDSNATLSALGLMSDAIGTKEGAQGVLKKLDDALVKINGIRSNLGAKQNRLSSAINTLSVTDENLSAAKSRIRDVDIAEETADMTKNNILVSAGVSVLAQANQSTQAALKLIG
ncbi:MAG: flagellin FliC [Bacteriovoracaceae bacterium]|jgi:flagellin|nr:flagellin FliC [Bacteriovoracaceae bacterium]